MNLNYGPIDSDCRCTFSLLSNDQATLQVYHPRSGVLNVSKDASDTLAVGQLTFDSTTYILPYAITFHNNNPALAKYFNVTVNC